MNTLGSGRNGELTFIDVVGLLSFIVGIKNLDLNITQEDFQQMMQTLDEQTNTLLTEIHAHLEEQDKKLENILEILNHGDNERAV